MSFRQHGDRTEAATWTFSDGVGGGDSLLTSNLSRDKQCGCCIFWCIIGYLFSVPEKELY